MTFVPSSIDGLSSEAAASLEACAAGLLGTAALMVRLDGRLAAAPCAVGAFYAAMLSYPVGAEWLLSRVHPVVEAAVERRRTTMGDEQGMAFAAIPLPEDGGEPGALVLFTSFGVRLEMRSLLAADLGLPATVLMNAVAEPVAQAAPHAVRLLEQALAGRSSGNSTGELHRYRALLTATRSLLAATTEADVLREACESVVGLLHADRAIPYAFGKEGWTPSAGVSYWGAAEPRDGALELTAMEEAGLARGETVTLPTPSRARCLVLPLMSVRPPARDVEALIAAEIDHVAQPVTSAEMDAALLVCRQAGLALRNVRHAAMERNLAGKLQDLLQSHLDVQALPGLEMAEFYRPAAQDALVGGDFYDAFPLPDGRAVVLVGDVAGKGVDAALHTHLVRDALRAYSRICRDPGEILALANEALAAWPEFRDFATLALAILDPAAGRICYAGAGHPASFLYRKSVDSIGALESTGAVLGIMSGLKWGTVSHRWSAGDAILLYTDGISEAHAPGSYDLFETTRIRDAFRVRRRGAPDAILDAVFQAVRSFSRGVMHDDCAMLAVRHAGE
ncbi:MAG TPA: PP2C family protein-serine/threonine phosphatase [Armatimonadota bacterium]|jgi:hypothetical protein